MDKLPEERLHALDNLRAMVMWLGIVLHVSVNHLTVWSGLPWRDATTTPLADLLVVFIHSFRMPVFFVLSGYLAAMMLDTRGLAAWVRNRARRLALPFVVFWPVLLVAMSALIMAYVHLRHDGTIGLDAGLMPGPKGLFNTMHMWFLYTLIWLTALAAALCAVQARLPASVGSAWRRGWAAVVASWWGVLLLALPLAVVAGHYRNGMLPPDSSFLPNPMHLLYHGLYFAIGWALYRQRDFLLPRWSRSGWRYALGGAVAFIVSLVLLRAAAQGGHPVAPFQAAIAYVYAVAGICWSIALIGLFLRYLPRQNRAMRYLADSAYWVFLVHMLGTIGFGVLLYHAPMGALARMGINIVATTAVCLLSYHWLVRRTWVGVLLNGKRIG
jgi:glucan biosynthesis protein C